MGSRPPEVEVTCNGPVVHIRFARPDKLNAITWAMSGTVTETLADAESDDPIGDPTEGWVTGKAVIGGRVS